MNKNKERAIELRRSGKSYKQIHREIGVSISTLSDWFKDEPWSQEIRDRLGMLESLSFPTKLASMIRANKERWSRLRQSYRDAGEKEFESLRNSDLFLAGIMLYWGEGTRDPKGSQVKLTNTDPAMIRLFYLFLKDVLRVSQDRICIWLLLYPDLKDQMQKNFWSRATGVPLSQFKNSIYINGRHPTKRLSYGVCNISVRSRELKEKMLTWLNMYQKILIR